MKRVQIELETEDITKTVDSIVHMVMREHESINSLMFKRRPSNQQQGRITVWVNAYEGCIERMVRTIAVLDGVTNTTVFE